MGVNGIVDQSSTSLQYHELWIVKLKLWIGLETSRLFSQTMLLMRYCTLRLFGSKPPEYDVLATLRLFERVERDSTVYRQPPTEILHCAHRCNIMVVSLCERRSNDVVWMAQLRLCRLTT